MPVALVAEAVALLALVARMVTRPLWYNEQWRAYHLVLPSMPWRASGDTNSPISFGFAALERAATALLGRNEVALRVPELVALPVLAVVTYRLARRWLGPPVAGLTVAALLLNRMVLTYGAELAPYTVEAAAVTSIVLLWLGARGAAGRRRAYRYAAMAALALVATPAMFVLAPLLALDLLDAVRARAWRPLVAPVLAGAVALVHAAVYLGAQQVQANTDYWDDWFLPHDPAGLARGLARGLGSWVPRALTGGTSHLPLVPDGSVPFPLAGRVALGAFMAVAVVAGVACGLRDPRVRPLPVAVAGAFAAQAAASYAHDWPFGFTRVNAFLLPLLYVLAAVGVTGLPRRARPVGVAAYVLVLAVGAVQVAAVRREAPGPAFGTGVRELVRTVREGAAPGDVVVLVHPMLAKGWAFYMDDRDGGTGLRVRPRETLVVDPAAPDAAGLAAFLRAHAEARHVWVVALRGSQPAAVEAVLRDVRDASYAETSSWRDADTGGMRELTRQETPGTG